MTVLFFFSCNSWETPGEDKSETPVVEEEHQDTSSTVRSHKKVERRKMGNMIYETTYYDNGQVKTEGNLENEKREGKWMSWYENGMPWSETWFKEDKKHGPTTVWYNHGVKFYSGQFENNKEAGKWTYWDENGEVLKEVDY